MCFHDKPTRNDNDSYGVEGRAPKTAKTDKLIYDECGRCSPQINGKGQTDYHSFHFRLVQDGERGEYHLLVRHGGGDERIPLGYPHTRIAELLGPLNSDARYLLLHAFYTTHGRATDKAEQRIALKWRSAFVDKRLKKRKYRGTESYKVWIVPEPQV